MEGRHHWDFRVVCQGVTYAWDLRRCLFDDEALSRMQLIAFHVTPNERFSYEECTSLAPVTDDPFDEEAFVKGDSHVAEFWLDKQRCKAYFYACFVLHEILLKKERFRKNMLPPDCLRSLMQMTDAKKLVVELNRELKDFPSSSKAILFAFLCRCARQTFKHSANAMHFSDALEVSHRLYLKLAAESAPVRDVAILRAFDAVEKFIGDLSLNHKIEISENPRTVREGEHMLCGRTQVLEYFLKHYGFRAQFTPGRQHTTFFKHYLYSRLMEYFRGRLTLRSTLYIQLRHAPQKEIDKAQAMAMSRVLPVSEQELMDTWFIRRVQAQ